MPRLTKQEKEWQAQDDARTLASAEEVKSDKPRLNAAKKQARIMAKEQQQRASSLKKIGGVKTTSNTKIPGVTK